MRANDSGVKPQASIGCIAELECVSHIGPPPYAYNQPVLVGRSIACRGSFRTPLGTRATDGQQCGLVSTGQWTAWSLGTSTHTHTHLCSEGSLCHCCDVGTLHRATTHRPLHAFLHCTVSAHHCCQHSNRLRPIVCSFDFACTIEMNR